MVSVIIPNYNHAAYLKQRIDSVLNQTYQDLELIILDDCSSDNSREIIEQYRNHKKVSDIFYNEKNSGNPFQQWHKGIESAGGKYIWIAESDDWCEITLLENLVKGLDENDNCVISYCQSYCVQDDGSIRFQSNHSKLNEYVAGGSFISNSIIVKNPIFNAGMAVWRKSAYSKILKEYINYRLTGDYYFWIELCTCGDVYISGKLLNYFRQHNKNVSFNSAKSGLAFIEQIQVFKRILDREIINKYDYLIGLKKAYYIFKQQGKNIPRENVVVIRKLFATYSKARYKLYLYFFQKKVQSFSRKLLRL